MTEAVRHFFASGNTAQGEHHLTPLSFQYVKTLFLLQGKPGSGKSTMIARLAEEMQKQGEALELFHSSLYPNELDALINTDLKVGVADAERCKGLSLLQTADIITINFDTALDESLLSNEDQTIIEHLNTQLQEAYTNAYNTFDAALRAHDVLEQIFITRMDFSKVDQIVHELTLKWLDNQPLEKQAVVRHFFFGAATPTGAQDHILDITKSLQHRIFIKGRPGSGKSTLLKKLSEQAILRGIDTEVFHCGFDPNSLDMLIFPECSLAIFDSTAPHEYFPSRSGDEVLDMYERAIVTGTDEQCAAEIAVASMSYSSKMKEATSYLAQVKQLDSRIKAYYTGVTDFSMINQWYRLLQSEIRARRR